MLGKFISETYNKVKSKADEVRLHVSVQAIKAKEVLGLVKPTTIEQLEILLNYELQQIDTGEALIGTYKKWIYNISQSEKSECIRYYKSIKPTNEKKESTTLTTQSFTNSNEKHKYNNIQERRKSEVTLPNSNITSSCNNDMNDVYDSHSNNEKSHIEQETILDIHAQNNAVTTTTVKLNDNVNSDPQQHLSLKSKEVQSNDKCKIGDELLITDKSKTNSINKYESNTIINKKQMTTYIYDDHYGYNFKEYFLKSNILEKSISLILEKREIRLSLVGPIETDDLDNPRTTILTMFNHCLMGNEKLHKDILFIILTTDKLFDNHKELFLELLTILKYDHLDIYLTNIRKIISSEIVSLKSKIHFYDSQFMNINKLIHLDNITPKTSISSIDLEKDDENDHQKYGHMVHQDSSILNPSFNSNYLPTESHLRNHKIDNNQAIIDNSDEKNESYPINEQREVVSLTDEANLTEVVDPRDVIKHLKNQQIDDTPKTNEEKIFEIENAHDINNNMCTELSKEIFQMDLLSNEKEIIESNKMQQIKILASSKLIELHKTLQRVLILATENRENKKIEIKTKLKELKKIMDVCKKDCEITLNDTEDSKTHLENAYVKELDVKTNSISKTQEQINQMKSNIDELLKKKKELFNQYQLICNEINLRNKELSTVLSTLTNYKKDLNEAEMNYLNKLSNTNKAKHMHQERKLYISHLDTISDEILTEYGNSSYINTEELLSKTIKIKKPINQAIMKHLIYLKEKLIILNALLKFYVHRVNSILGQNDIGEGPDDHHPTNQSLYSEIYNIEGTNSHDTTDHHNHDTTDHHNHDTTDHHNHDTTDHHNHDTTDHQNYAITDLHKRATSNNSNDDKREDHNASVMNFPSSPIINHHEQEKKKKLMKYKNCYFKIVEQISKIWVSIQEFYDLNKENIDQEETECSPNFVYQQINEIYNYSKKFIMHNDSIVSSIV
ncbi:hypothetical protein, conserved [Plasmodium gonderi]|uniref:Uncharacterized protein n=1 Tax=Plasmodium gonderi TaxID=77519 RepID=A0A1Y1JD44_PLAGO|nr:hypothetical protein, conserved [Plasmodium gonderi]GAW80451.1 hypothetical protein, conserved [Plasmodium gonderi]